MISGRLISAGIFEGFLTIHRLRIVTMSRPWERISERIDGEWANSLIYFSSITLKRKKLKQVKSLNIDLMDQESQTFDIIWTVPFLAAFPEFWVDYFQPYK